MSTYSRIHAIDVHAEGEPGRVLIGSHLHVKGATMAERLQYCEKHLDDLRRLLLREPRGYPALCGALVLPPADPAADFGLVVLEQGGFRPMSGSNLICAVTALVETGAVTVSEPVTDLTVDTAVGLVRVRAEVSGGRARRVTFANVPAFAVALDHVLDLPEYGRVPVDIVFGGQFFVQARAADLGLVVEPGAAKQLARAGAVLRTAAQQQFPVAHPLNPDINEIALTMIHGPSPTPGVSGRNTVVLPNGPVDLADPATWTGSLDRSPCGTGTCARMAALHARGELPLNTPFVHESVIGTTFTGTLLDTAQVGPYQAVLPTISGRGWITGFNQYVLDDTDPFPYGYTLGDLWGATEQER
ncbi:proline racemase family protein [Streptomyces ferrugineus]|uniref:Proline racemase family protein n=1 Tax=Streptomyces ferrugineus TaxID=1413221 RepID=A0A7M2SAY0_9ACTN|nr:proline racemase family protein [Streptomyces ferrugineus]QOV33179.1 proline racemase family protein [Streptomyces ferrugineus]